MRADRRGEAYKWPTATELRWAAGFAAAVMALTCLPYCYGLLIRPPDAYYSGLLTNPDEHNVYLAYMKQAQEGAVFLVDPFTSEPQSGRVVNIFFLALGQFGRLSHLALPVVYHVARLVSGWLLLMAIYCLGAQVIETISGRRLGLALAALASGFGWLYRAAPGGPHPIDYGAGLVMPEAITFLSLLLNPLFCFSAFLMVAAVGLSGHAISSGSARSAVLAGLAGLALGSVHTYDVIPVSAALAAYLALLLLAKRLSVRGAAMAVIAAVIAAPSLVYQVCLLRSGEVMLAIKIAETPVHSPEPLFLALGLGLPLVLGVIGIARATRSGSATGARLLALWLVLGLGLVYAPVPFQRKLAEGIQVPAALLAAFGLEPALRRCGAFGGILGTLLVALALPSNALYLARAKTDLEMNNAAYLGNLMPPLYLRSDQRRAFQWLDEHASPGDVLLCNSFLGSYAPSLGGLRVYVGHWAETLHFRAKLATFAAFLRADTPDDSREAFVRREGITYVLRDRSIYDDVSCLSPEGKALRAFEPDSARWLQRVWQEDSVSLYRVK